MKTESTASRYHRWHLALGAAGLGVGTIYLGFAMLTDAGHTLSRYAAAVSDAWWWRVAVVAAVVGAGHTVLTLPLAWFRGFALPRQYGLLHQPFASWLADRLKAKILGAVFGLVVIEVTYGLMRLTALWWLVAAAFVTLVSLLVAAIFPVWILPLFYRGTPLADEALGERLVGLAARAGIRIVDVQVVDQSRKSRTANAALTGLGRTRRIILFDTLVREFTADEIESVLAHELAHHLHHDVWRIVGTQSAVTLVTFWIADRVMRATGPVFGIDGPADPAGLPWLALVLGTLALVAVPLVNLVSRGIERQADDRGLALTRDATAFVGAMERLAELNLAVRKPPRLEEALLFSHPSIDRRIARARARATGGMPAATSR